MRRYIRQLKARYVFAVLASAMLVGGGAALSERDALAREKTANPPVRLNVDETPMQRDQQLVTSFAGVVKNVSPSVVKVYTTMKAKERGEQMFNPFFNDPLFRRFFGDRFENPGMRRNFRMPPQHGLGSGVIVTRDGYILTNNHVVENADEVKVQVGERGEEFTAKVVGTDPKTDIAVLKIEARDRSFPAITTADSDKIEVGDVVLAVGNPFGIGQTVTMGIVSATGRATLGMEYEDFIQTDAAINPGNSGGALVDAQGRLIGINTAILSRSGGNQGIGFAVPVNLARYVMENLIEHGRVIRGYMGVNIQNIDPGLAEKFELDSTDGALIAEVTKGSPAEEAGLKSGDVILEFDGKRVQDSRNLKLQVAQTPPDKKVPVKISRNGKVKELEVRLKEFPRDEALARADRGGSAELNDVTDGITVDNLSPALRQQFNIPRHIDGALITDVDPESVGYRAGLRPGDVILEINREPVKSADDAIAMTEDLKGDVLLRVWSRGGSRFVVLKDNGKAG